MPNYLDNIKIDNGDKRLYTEGFIRLVEDHLLELRDPNIAQIQVISDSEGIMYRSDFYRYARDVLGIKERWLQNLLLRVNRMETNRDFGPNWKFILLPDKGYINRLCSTYLG